MVVGFLASQSDLGGGVGEMLRPTHESCSMQLAMGSIQGCDFFTHVTSSTLCFQFSALQTKNTDYFFLHHRRD